MIKKDKIIKLRVTNLEKSILQNKAKKAGLGVSEFLRRLAFEKELKTRLTKEEIEIYQSLSKYADNFRRIGNLFKKGDTTGVKEEAIATSRLIKKHFKKFQ